MAWQSLYQGIPHPSSMNKLSVKLRCAWNLSIRKHMAITSDAPSLCLWNVTNSEGKQKEWIPGTIYQPGLATPVTLFTDCRGERCIWFPQLPRCTVRSAEQLSTSEMTESEPCGVAKTRNLTELQSRDVLWRTTGRTVPLNGPNYGPQTVLLPADIVGNGMSWGGDPMSLVLIIKKCWANLNTEHRMPANGIKDCVVGLYACSPIFFAILEHSPSIY